MGVAAAEAGLEIGPVYRIEIDDGRVIYTKLLSEREGLFQDCWVGKGDEVVRTEFKPFYCERVCFSALRGKMPWMGTSHVPGYITSIAEIRQADCPECKLFDH